MARSESSQDANIDCPTPKRLCNWLDGRLDLDEHEAQHVASCESCGEWIETHTAAPELQEISAGVVEHTTIYDEEPEFQDLQRRLAEESHAPTPRRPTPPTARLELDLLQLGLPSRYVLRRPIASGGIASVFLAFDQTLSQDVAIKVLKRDSGDERKRFLREARILAELKHPNIVRIFDVGELKSTNAEVASVAQTVIGLPYIVMEYVAGGTVEKLNCGADTDYELITQRLIDAANGLAVAHKNGVIHRDVKPNNLLIDKARSVCKVADFGLAKFSNVDATQITRIDELLGTPAYMSPEQVAGSGAEEDLTVRTDVYSLGASMYFLLTGNAPLQGTTAGLLRQIPEIEPVAPRVLYPDLPRDLESICARAMEKNPSDRYPTMEDFANDLQRFLDGKPTVARPLSTSRQLLRWSRRNRSLAIALACVCGLILILGIGATTTAVVLWKQKRALLAQQRRTLDEMSNKVAMAEPESLPVAFSDLQEHRAEVIAHLEDKWQESDAPRTRLNIACAFNTLGVDRSEFIVDELGPSLTRPAQCLALCIALSQDTEKSLQIIERKLKDDLNLTHRIKLSIVALHLGEDRFVQQIVESGPDQRTELIHTIPTWHGTLSQLINYCSSCEQAEVLMAVVLGLGLVDRQEFSDADLGNLASVAEKLDRPSSDRGVRSASQWLRRRLPLAASGDSRLNVESPESLALHPKGFRMLHVQAGTFNMGNDDPRSNFGGRTKHSVTLTRDFLLADREVSVGLFRVFLESRKHGDEQTSWQCDEIISPTDNHPAQTVTWFEAVEFCNWLSDLHGFSPYYAQDGVISVEAASGDFIEMQNWNAVADANGYRLPTEAEFEFACRAGTDTVYSFGDDTKYFDNYVAWSNNTRVATATCGNLMPNPWGFFEMHGNVWEWCEDWYQPFTPEPKVDPRSLEPNAQGRVFRGGGVCTFTGYPDSNSRGYASPKVRYNNLGFRVARSVD